MKQKKLHKTDVENQVNWWILRSVFNAYAQEVGRVCYDKYIGTLGGVFSRFEHRVNVCFEV